MAFISLRTKMFFNSSILVIFSIVMIFIGSNEFVKSRNFSSKITPLSNQLFILSKLKAYNENINYQIEQYLLTSGQVYKESFANDLSKIYELLSILKIQEFKLTELKAIEKLLLDSSDKFNYLATSNSIKSRERNEYIYIIYRDLSQISSSYQILLDENLNSIQEHVSLQQSSIRKALIIFISFGIVVIILYFILHFRTSLLITNSILNLKRATTEVTHGNFETKTQINSNDEVEDLANNFETMTEKIKSNIDILQEKQKELKQTLSIKELLFKEMHHRVKNNLQIVSSIIQMDANTMKSKEGSEHLENACLRINTMGLIHEQLYQLDDLSKIDMKTYLEGIVNKIESMFQSRCKNIKIRIEIKKVNINLETAIPCGLIINEIITNSFKYAFDNEKNPKIYVNLEQRDDILFLKIYDNGKGLPIDVSFNQNCGLGLQLINLLVTQLKGNVKIIRTSGTEYNIDFKMERKEENRW